MVAYAARVNLHDEAVFEAHLRHFSEHLGAEELLLLGVGFAGKNLAEEFRGIGRGKVGGLRGGVAVIGGCAAQLLKRARALRRAFR